MCVYCEAKNSQLGMPDRNNKKRAADISSDADSALLQRSFFVLFFELRDLGQA